MQVIKDVAFRAGLNIGRQTPAEIVAGLVDTLKPVDCGVPLLRIGAESDGGYLIPDDLEGIEYCFSPGVSSVAEFENHLASLGIRSFMADYSVDAPPISRAEFTFDKKFLGATNSEKFITLETWKTKHLPLYTKDLLLQMDIEGSECEVILSTPDCTLSQFRIMVIEFHFLEKLFDPFVFALYRSCFDKLSKHFYVAHLHPNNCCGSVSRSGIEIPRTMEFTFYNKKRVQHVRPTRSFPHPLDRDNVPDKPSLVLPEYWR